jgi:hypothetical protein
MSSKVLKGAVGGRDVDPTPEDIASLMQEAVAALSRDNHERADVEGEPILVAPDIASPVRLPNLIPDEWPSLTKMIMKAVEQD